MNLGDVILYSGSSLFSMGIKWADHSIISHTGVCTAHDTITEALSTVVTRSSSDSFADAIAVYACRLKGLDPQTAKRLADYAAAFTGDSYGWADIGLQLADVATRSRFFTSKIGPKIGTMKHPICSFVAAETYEKVLDYSFGLDVYSVTPADIYKWVTSRDAWVVEKIK